MQYQRKLGHVFASVVVAGLLAGGCASHRGAGPRAQIEQRLQEVLAAAASKDFTRLDSYHLYGPRFTKFTGSSPERLDAAATRTTEHEGLTAAEGLRMRAEDLKIDLFGNVGIATFLLEYSFDARGQSYHRKERSTLVFVKDGTAWRIAHEHLSPIKE